MIKLYFNYFITLELEGIKRFKQNIFSKSDLDKSEVMMMISYNNRKLYQYLTFIVIGLFIVFLAAPIVPVVAQSYKPGDVTGDNILNILDVVLISQHILGFEDLSEDQLIIADVNNDGTVNITDLTLIVKKILGLIDDFDMPENDTDDNGHQLPASQSTYSFSYEIRDYFSPDEYVYESDSVYISPGEYVYADVTFKTDVEGDKGYDGVRFSIEADGDGNVEFSGKDHSGNLYNFTNTGYWGPSTGLNIPASYDHTLQWTLHFSKTGLYEIKFSLIDASTGNIVNNNTDTINIRRTE